jgi:hypothetical protein
MPTHKIYDRYSTNIGKIALDFHHQVFTKSYTKYVNFNMLNLHFIVQVNQREEKLQELVISAMNEGMPVRVPQTLKENIL